MAVQGDCVHAVPEFENLKAAPAFAPEKIAGALVLVLRGQCLVRLGLDGIGEKSITEGLPTLRKQGHQFDADIAASLVSLGDAAIARWDYARAKVLYLEASEMNAGLDPIMLNTKLAKATAFDGGPEPLRYAAEALHLAEADPQTSKDHLAAFHTVHARILLNQGNAKDAYAELRQALTLSGGLGLKVSRADVVLRSDLAVAAQLAGDMAGAREYLSYTGAGRFEKGRLTRGFSMELPVCGTETGLRPQDLAIVEFTIGSDGLVSRATPIYSPGTADVAAQFARAVSEWAWDPETLNGIPPFFLQATHVEVRCTKVAQQVPDSWTPLHRRFETWARDTLGLAPMPPQRSTAETAELMEKLRAMVKDDGTAPKGAKRVAAEGLLLIHEAGTVTSIEGHILAAEADSADLPPEAASWLTFMRTAFQLANSPEEKNPKNRAEPKRSTLLALLDLPAIADDPIVSATIRLSAAEERLKNGRKAVRPELYQQVAGDDRLPAYHPLRQLANLSLANFSAQQGNFEQAAAYFEATGLTEEQCAVIGARPSMKRNAFSSNDYPDDAARLGFEGWVQLEFDVESAGKAAEVRAIVAYPPFIFNNAAANGIEQSLFEASYRPSGGTACSASRQSVSFVRPR
jgi:outer membrane biosynthesis protein TonB